MKADVVIIGCGPAGLQAGIHSSRRKADTIIIGKPQNSALYGAHIENYFGAGRSDGSNLLDSGLKQAVSFGCRHINMNVINAAVDSFGFKVTVESGQEITCKTIVIATGISRKKLNIPGEKEFLGKGVSYCTECDCNFFKGLMVAIIGDESQAAISSELMTKYASKVYWISENVSADAKLVDKATWAGVQIVPGTPKAILGEKNVESLVLQSGQNIVIDGVFIELGGMSSSDLAMGLGVMPEVDDTIKVNKKCETSVAGIFACGDITGGLWQLAKAVGEGAVAGHNAAGMAKGQR